MERVCGICDRKSKKTALAKWVFGVDYPVCFNCYSVWRHGNQTDVSKIRELSLKQSDKE